MRKIEKETVLKVYDILLWENSDHREEFFGPWSVVTIHHHGTTRDEDYYLTFPDTDIPQYMDKDSITRNCHVITEAEDPEYFL